MVSTWRVWIPFVSSGSMQITNVSVGPLRDDDDVNGNGDDDKTTMSTAMTMVIRRFLNGPSRAACPKPR